MICWKNGQKKMNENKDFEQVYNDYYQMILNYINKKLSSYQDAEDLTQDILAACYRNWNRYDSKKASVKTWIFVIVKNKLKNYYRDKKQTYSLDDEENPIGLVSENLTEEVVLFGEYKAVLYEALKSLNDIDRRIITEQYFFHKSSLETARLLQLEPGNVRVRKNRALEKLRKYFKAHGYTQIR
ncbi:MAG: RNA polymerase sigma factor [Eubacterium sp.]|nr:RNA polymerase sigma factor [Eubacterium sp.]